VIAIERMAYEAVEDAARQGILLFEARFCPHLIFPEKIVCTKSQFELLTLYPFYEVIIYSC